MNINLVQANWELYNKASDKQKREFIVSYIGSEVTEEKNDTFVPIFNGFAFILPPLSN